MIKKPALDLGGYYLGDCIVTSSHRLSFSLFIPPLLNKMETVWSGFSWQALETAVARQLNAKFWNPDNSVFQALKSKDLKIDWAVVVGWGSGFKESKGCKWSKWRFVMLFILARDSQLRIVFFHSHVSGFFVWRGCCERKKLADTLTQIVLKWS